MKEILEKVMEQFKADDVECHIETVNGVDTLRLIPVGFGPDHDNSVVMEICRIPMDDADDCCYIQFYTTVAVNLKEKDYPEILLKLNEVNLSTLVGYYGILAESGMVYHKAIMRLPMMSDDKLAEAVIGTAYDCFAVIDFNFEEMLRIIE